MILYFINGSMQSKELIESDYAEDIIDIIIDFFESHGAFPHMLEGTRDGEDFLIRWPNTREHFRIKDVGEDEENTIREWMNP